MREFLLEDTLELPVVGPRDNGTVVNFCNPTDRAVSPVIAILDCPINLSLVQVNIATLYLANVLGLRVSNIRDRFTYDPDRNLTYPYPSSYPPTIQPPGGSHCCHYTVLPPA